MCETALQKFIDSVPGIKFGPINRLNLPSLSLGWFRGKSHENLHVFDDGIILGKLSFSEESRDQAIYHDGNMPQEILPLSTGVRVKISENEVIVEPFNITNIYYGQESVSDMQLLIADAEGLLPSHESVAVFAAMGYYPGNMTLFSEVQKIPFRSTYDLISRKVTTPRQIEYQLPDDEKLLDRLLEVLPYHPRQYLSLSAGYDSRFILGIMKNAGVTPELIHVKDHYQTKLVEQLAEQLNIPLTVVRDYQAHLLDPKTYTLLTDAQIYLRGGNYSSVRNSLRQNSLYHTGIFSGPIIKKVYGTATKFLFSINSLYSNLIEYVSLTKCDSTISGLTRVAHKEDLRNFLMEKLAFGNEYCCFKTDKEWANWFCYMHEAIRWGQAHLSDLSYFSQPVFLLSDLPATMLGISSKASDNYLHDRVRKFNYRLLPELTVPYNYAGSYVPEVSLTDYWRKLRSEYISRAYLEKYIFHMPDQRDLIKSKAITMDEKIEINSSLFGNYFSERIESFINNTNYTYTAKRAAATIGYALEFLESSHRS